MKELKFKELVSYAGAFASFVLPKIECEEIILFGSAARGEADKDSDIDIFLNVRKDEGQKETIKEELKRFYKSKIYETFFLKGIKNPIKIEVGKLDEWKLKRSIISDGIMLYGKYRGMPEKTKGFIQFNLKPIKNIAKRNKVIRMLFGRKEEDYSSEGIVYINNGKRLSASAFIVPIEKSKEIVRLLNSEKVDYSLFEFWSDAF